MKLESLVIVYQKVTVNQQLEGVHTAHHILGFGEAVGFVGLLVVSNYYLLIIHAGVVLETGMKL
jgi:hypothetical protein